MQTDNSFEMEIELNQEEAISGLKLLFFLIFSKISIFNLPF